MSKEVVISVKGSRIDTNNEMNVLEFVTEGVYLKIDNEYIITYRESAVTGMEGTTTTVRIADGIVTLARFGKINTQFIFQQGCKHVSYYDTVHGSFVVGIIAKEVNISFDETGGEIWIDYQLEIDNNSVGDNDLYMMIRTVDNNKGEIYKELLSN